MDAPSSDSTQNQDVRHLRQYEKLWPDYPIRYLILSTNDFIVFLDNELDVDWSTSEQFDQRWDDSQKQKGHVLNRVAHLHAVPVEHLNINQKLNFRRMLAEAVARVLEDDIVSANEMLDSAAEFVSARNQETARVWYLSATSASTGIVVFCAVLLWCFRDYFVLAVGQTLLNVSIGSAAGAVGAFFSILLRVGHTPLDPSAGRLLHWFEGAGRVAVGMIAAFAALLAVRIGILLPVASNQGVVGALLVGFIAGAAERLVPTFIKRIEIDASHRERATNRKKK